MKKKTVIAIIFSILISSISCLFLLKSGIIKGHDLEYHLSRILGISNCLNAGDFKAIIHPGLHGYGYANGLFYSNLFLYLPAILHSLGLNVITSYKILIFFSSLLTCLSMFYCTKSITKSNKIASLSSILYTLCSYRICDVMVRAALGETLAFIFIPIIILGLYEILFRDYNKWYIFSLGFVGLVNCHLISTVLMAIIVVIILLCYISNLWKEKKRLFALIISGCVGLSLGAFFIIPMLQQYVSTDLLINSQENTISSVMPFLKIFVGFPNYTTRFIPGGIGVIYIVFIIMRLKLKNMKDKKLLKFSDLMMITGVICLLASTDLIPWLEISKFLGSIQFTWRLFLFSSFFLSISGAIIFVYWNKNHSNTKYLLLLGFIIFSCILNQVYSYKSLQTYYYTSKVDYLTDYHDFVIASGEYLPKATDWSLIDTDERIIRSNSDSVKIKSYEKNNKYYITFDNNEGEFIDVPYIYYRGYKAYSLINNKEYNVQGGYNTWCRINIGGVKSDKIVLVYEGTLLFKISYLVSLITLILLTIWILFPNVRKLIMKKKSS